MAEKSSDEDVFVGDSDGYQPDSDSDSDGYRLEENADEDLRRLIDGWKRMTDGWWNKAGYVTYWDYVKESEAKWARMGFDSIYSKKRKRPKAKELPQNAPPQLDLDAVAADATRPQRSRDRQVNVRLTQLGYDALSEAARAYGLRPTTLARLLIHRGALAVLEEQKR